MCDVAPNACGVRVCWFWCIDNRTEPVRGGAGWNIQPTTNMSFRLHYMPVPFGRGQSFGCLYILVVPDESVCVFLLWVSVRARPTLLGEWGRVFNHQQEIKCLLCFQLQRNRGRITDRIFRV